MYLAGRPVARLGRRSAWIVAAVVALAAMIVAAPAQAHAPYTILSWGQNGHGTLGNGASGFSHDVPVAVSGLSGVAAVESERGTIFYGHALALLENGSVWGWGRNNRGQVGDGTAENDKNPPVPVCAVGSTPAQCEAGAHLSGVKAVAAGNVHSLALLANGTVAEWGSPSDGAPSPTPVAKSGLSGVKALAAGGTGNEGTEDFSLALLENGTVVSWGANGSGRLGDAVEEVPSVEPTSVCAVGEKAPCLSHLGGVKAIAADVDGGLALLEGGTVVAWGANSAGQLGNGTNASSSVPVGVCAVGATAPCTEASQQLKGVSAIAAGQRTSVALLENGTVVSWGQSDLGNGTPTRSSTPVPVCAAGETAPCANDLSGATAVASGGESPTASYALLGSGGVLAWGDGTWHELGDGSTQSSLVPVAVCAGGEEEKAPCANNLANAKAIAAGDEQGFAIGPYPLVTGVSPKEANAGKSVTLSGVNFTGATGVRFGSTAAKTFKVNSDSSITVTVPTSTQTGSVDVYVTTPEGTSGANAADQFTNPSLPGTSVPELGRCKAVAQGTGAWKGINCEHLAEGKGRYDFFPSAEKKKFEGSSSTTVLSTPKFTISCAATILEGEYTGAKTATATLVLKGCINKATSKKCQSKPGSEGEIESSEPLEGEIGFIKGGEKPTVGLDLRKSAKATSLASFFCANGPEPPEVTGNIEGSVIGQLTPLGRMTPELKLAYKGSKGTQTAERFEGRGKDTLEITFVPKGVEPPVTENASLSASLLISNEEPLEIKPLAFPH